MRYNIKGKEDLDTAIRLLENEVHSQRELLTSQLNDVYSSFTPLGIIRDVVQEVVTSQEFRGNIITAAMGISAGYLTKKLLVGGSSSILKKIAGNLIQFGIADLIVNPARALETILLPLIGLLRPESGQNEEDPASPTINGSSPEST